MKSSNNLGGNLGKNKQFLYKRTRVLEKYKSFNKIGNG